MSHHLHDGPAPLYYRAKPMSPIPRASLAALQWAADRAGLSYGRFTQSIRQMDEMRIQKEYEAYCLAREQELRSRKTCVATTNEVQ